MPSYHTHFKVLKFSQDGKGELVCNRLTHQKEHKNMVLSELGEDDVNSAFAFGNKQSPLKGGKETKIHYKGLRFLSNGTLLSVAYYIKQK